MVGDLRPDDNVGLVPDRFHIRVIEDLDWYAGTISISAGVSRPVLVWPPSTDHPLTIDLLIEEAGHIDCTCAEPSSHVFFRRWEFWTKSNSLFRL